MRLLFEMDSKNYDPAGVGLSRPSARCVTIRDGKVAMVHSAKYNSYKFPGGGIEPGETPEEAMIREALEEAGLVVIPASVREYGLVHRVDRSVQPGVDYFVQDNYYFLCQVEPTLRPQKLDGYEAAEGYTLKYVDPDRAIRINRAASHGPQSPAMLEREARVLELLKQEGYFDKAETP